MSSFNPDPDQRNRGQGAGALVFIGLALVLTYLPPPQQQQIAAFVRSTALRPFIATQEVLTRARQQTQEAGQLRETLDSLAAVVTNQSTLAEENARLRRLLDLQRRVGTTYGAATLLRPGTAGSESMFLLDVEGNQDIRVGAPVISPDGLVGVVREVSGGQAIGMDWTHPDFRASVMTADGETYGIVEPRRGEFREEDRLVLTGTPFTTRLDPGTWIVTSGRGATYPRGIPVGMVGDLAEAEGGWRKTYWIEPAVELGGVTHVLVASGEAIQAAPSEARLGPSGAGGAGTDSVAGPSAGISDDSTLEAPADSVAGSGPDFQSIMLDGSPDQGLDQGPDQGEDSQ